MEDLCIYKYFKYRIQTLDIGDEVKIMIENEKIVIVPVKKKRKPKLNIHKLFKEKYEENEEYNWGRVGKEIW